ncbi:MAG: hypothetical protein GOP50_05860 [Candidatus Heimdallarchaeota archaeon]|nr:hypothetical protein [Candidatus Heimdallarchaeota archaeon]
MNKTNKFLTIILLGFLVGSLVNSALTYGAVASDSLVLTKGDYTKGQYLYSNTTVNNLLLAYIDVEVVDRFIPGSSAYEFVAIQVTIDFIEDFLDFEPYDYLQYTSLIFAHNRTTFLPTAQLKFANATYSEEGNLLHETDINELTNLDNTNVTLGDFSAIYGDLDIADPHYAAVDNFMFSFAMFNAIMFMYFPFTILAISPTANDGDTISFEATEGLCHGNQTIYDTNLDTHNSIHVEYHTTFVFIFDDLDNVNVFYHETSGLILRSVEMDTASNANYEFRPTDINCAQDVVSPTPTDDNNRTLPFPYLSVAIALTILSIVSYSYRKKK